MMFLNANGFQKYRCLYKWFLKVMAITMLILFWALLFSHSIHFIKTFALPNNYAYIAAPNILEVKPLISACEVQAINLEGDSMNSEGVQTIGDLEIGSLVVDINWEWEFRTGNDYTYEPGDETKPVTWIVVANNHYSGGDAGSVENSVNHVTLISEELIGKHLFDNSTNRCSEHHGCNHWGESGTPNATSGIRPFLNETFYGSMNELFKSAVLVTTLPNQTWSGESYTTEDKIFLPSQTEMDGGDEDTYEIGSGWGCFTDNSERIAQIDGNDHFYWTRSPASIDYRHVRGVFTDGSLVNLFHAAHGSYGVRPALNLPSDIKVSEHPNAEGNYYILIDEAPEVKYTLTLLASPYYGGTVSGTGSYSYGEKVTVSAVASPGYNFSNWKKGDEVISIEAEFDYTIPDENVTLTANFEIETFIVTFVDWDDDIIDIQDVNWGSDATAPDDPEKEGYIFTGWDTDFTNITSHLTVTATYDRIKYGHVLDSVSITVADVIAVLKHIIGLNVLTDEQKIRADVAGDGAVGVNDAILILRYIAGLIDKFPAEGT